MREGQTFEKVRGRLEVPATANLQIQEKGYQNCLIWKQLTDSANQTNQNNQNSYQLPKFHGQSFSWSKKIVTSNKPTIKIHITSIQSLTKHNMIKQHKYN